MQDRLQELLSGGDTKRMVKELSTKIAAHRIRVCQVLRGDFLRHPDVAQLVLVGMAADQPLESNFFPGLLEGLLGRLGIATPGEDKPATSSKEGTGHLWSKAVHEAVMKLEHREVDVPESIGLPDCLNLHYETDFLEKRSHQVPAAFSDPLFVPSMAEAVYQSFKPPLLSKASPFAGGSKVPPTSSQSEKGKTGSRPGPKSSKSVPERPVPRK